MEPTWTPVRTVSEAVSLIARKQAVLPTVSLQRFDNRRIVLVPFRDLPPVPLGLLWWTVNENARIHALAQVANDLQRTGGSSPADGMLGGELMTGGSE
jgi:hypothetical protein